MKMLLAGIMIIGGIMHFVLPGAYVQVMPTAYPAPLALVLISGVLEVLIGAGLLLPSFQRLAAWSLKGFLIIVVPVHLNMALNPELTPIIPEWLLWVRLLILQPLLFFWAHVYS